MQLSVEHRPRSRGVSQLMYVGDDDAVEKATYNRGAYVMCVGGLAYALLGPKKHRSVAAVIAAAGFISL